MPNKGDATKIVFESELPVEELTFCWVWNRLSKVYVASTNLMLSTYAGYVLNDVSTKLMLLVVVDTGNWS